MKRFVLLPVLLLLTTTCQDAGRITQPDGEPLSDFSGPNYAVTTTASGGPSVSAGKEHSCGVTTDGAAYCWGSNASGQLGDGTNTNSNVPVAVFGGLTFQSVSAGGAHSCGMMTDGSASCWGFNLFGQLGDGTNTDSNAPVAVGGGGGSSYQSVSAGNTHSCGATTVDLDYCWGGNIWGALGDRTNTDSNAPVSVWPYSPDLDRIDFQSVSAGVLHSCGVTTTGAAYCWGENKYSELGDGTAYNSNQPVAVVGGHTFQSVSIGRSHSCGVTTDGAAYCWGSNASGQLGNDKDPYTGFPLRVAGLYQSVSAGGSHSCGVTTDGAAYCWGSNASGQLGNGTNTNGNVPVAVAGGLIFRSVSAGESHSCGVTTAGAFHCWGGNGSGQLGDGTNTNGNVPVLVEYHVALRVQGDVVQYSSPPYRRVFAFRGAQRADGTVQGKWKLQNNYPDPDVTFDGKVTCFTVIGNQVWVGGVTTRGGVVGELQWPPGTHVGFWAEDTGHRRRGPPDRLSFLYSGTLYNFTDQDWCNDVPNGGGPPTLALTDVESGDIEIKD